MDRNDPGMNTISYITVVALRKESVDRNWCILSLYEGGVTSLSARRAWIEIALGGLGGAAPQGRSPQGERG